MPVITFKYKDLRDLGINMEKDELIDTLPMMSSDIEDFDDEEIKVEFFPNRPDNLSVEGVARSFKGFIGQEVGLAKYETIHSNEKIIVENEVAEIRWPHRQRKPANCQPKNANFAKTKPTSKRS